MNRKPSCISPEGTFSYGIHKPSYTTRNLRPHTTITPLGAKDDGSIIQNTTNFPDEDIEVERAGWVYEIPNPFPFRGTTYIDKGWADAVAEGKRHIALKSRSACSLTRFFLENNLEGNLLDALPRPLLLTLAVCSTDSQDLTRLAEKCCELLHDEKGQVTGLRYHTDKTGNTVPLIHDTDLYEAVANNKTLPDTYKNAMVLRPGAQGTSPISGEWPADEATHVYEYLRQNSYIPGGHYAANMADDAIRYSIDALKPADMHALRHLYYQRIYIQLAEQMSLPVPKTGPLSSEELETLRLNILERLDSSEQENCATLWGWNFGFDYTPTNYRLHASHQQIHQQYAKVPEVVSRYRTGHDLPEGTMPAFCCGDLIAEHIRTYNAEYNSDFFPDYLKALADNTRLDGKDDRPSSLIIWENEQVLLFVPKAQTSQWELQIMTKNKKKGGFCGNIIEASPACRQALDTALLLAQRVLAALGAEMVTSIEFSKRIAERKSHNQPLIYSLLPKIPFSMGGFSEAQLRFICGHYPEDFAAACRQEASSFICS